jgi:hypothetical protein
MDRHITQVATEKPVTKSGNPTQLPYGGENAVFYTPQNITFQPRLVG